MVNLHLRTDFQFWSSHSVQTSLPCFPTNNLGLLRPINTKFGKWVAYGKTHFGMAIRVSRVKAKVTVTTM